MRRAPRSCTFALRHGRSEANARRIIVSSPENGIRGFGLTDEGRRALAAELPLAVRTARLEPRSTLVLTSPFLRARETAAVLTAVLGSGEAAVEPRLRERGFGELELGPDAGYERIWRRDAEDPRHRDLGCESVEEVLERMRSVVDEAERAFGARDVVLVSHGDPLAILACALSGTPPGRHRSIPGIKTGELRLLHPPGSGIEAANE